MDFLNFLMALSPIVVVLVGILGFKKSAKTVSPIALAWTLILAFTYFNLDGLTFAENVKVLDPLVWKGIKEGLKIVLMVFGAFTILNLLRETGAIEDVKATIAQISDDRRVQVVIIGMMLPIFLEGAAGAGAPAAIAAPFLVALGFNPTTSIAIALLGDATPASFGGAGQVHERVELDLAARLRARPHGGVVDAGKMRGQVNLLAIFAFSTTHSPHLLASNSCDRSG